MAKLIVERRLRLGKQRAREKYEAIKARADRNEHEIRKLEKTASDLTAKYNEYISIAAGPRANSNELEREHQSNETSMRRSTKVIAWFTFVLGVVGIISAIISGATLIAIQGQLDAMQADQRPWVRLKSLDLVDGMVFEDGHIRFNASYELENVGHSVALRSIVYFHTFPSFSSGDYKRGPTGTSIDSLIADKEIQIDKGAYFVGHDILRYCAISFDERMRLPRTRSDIISVLTTIFPNESIQKEIINIDSADEELTTYFQNQFNRPYVVNVFACVRYVEPATDIIRYSPYFFRISAKGDRTIRNLEDQKYPADKLRLEKVSQYGE